MVQLSQPSPDPVVKPRRLIFISYSSKDFADYTKQFYRNLNLMLRGHEGLGFKASEVEEPDVEAEGIVDEGDIFLDRNRIRGGDVWRDKLNDALEETKVLILLVSEFSLTSKICMKHEVLYARSHGVPVIPVILHEVDWKGFPLPGTPSGQRMEGLHVLSKEKPIKSWEDKNQAWKKVTDGLVHALSLGFERGPAQPATSPANSSQRGGKLLPYLCNQTTLLGAFEESLQEVAGHSLLFVLRGGEHDRLQNFWDRLRLQDLPRVGPRVHRGSRPTEKLLKWPNPWTGIRVRRDLDAAMLRAVSEALTGDSDSLPDPPALAAHLGALEAPRHLIAFPRAQEPREALVAGIRAFMNLLESCPRGTPLELLVTALLLESERTPNETPVLPELQRPDDSRFRVIELDRLSELSRSDIPPWYQEQQVRQFTSLGQYDLADQLYPPNGGLRFAQFEKRLRELQIIE